MLARFETRCASLAGGLLRLEVVVFWILAASSRGGVASLFWAYIGSIYMMSEAGRVTVRVYVCKSPMCAETSNIEDVKKHKRRQNKKVGKAGDR